MNKAQVVKSLNKTMFKIKTGCRKNKPELLLIAGGLGVISGTVVACVSTTKISDIAAKKKEELALMHAKYEVDTVDTSSDVQAAIRKETTSIYAKNMMRYVVLYTPTVIIMGGSLACFVAGNVILRRRLVNMTAAYTAVSVSFKEYRERVALKYGRDAERDIRFNITENSEKVVTIGKNGKEKVTEEKVATYDPNAISDVARIFDSGCPGWCKDPQANMNFLKLQETVANKLLQSRYSPGRPGYVLLNEVYEMLGFDKTPIGAISGWMYDEEEPIGDNAISFGLYNSDVEATRRFVNGLECNVLLDFNIDGNILRYIG